MQLYVQTENQLIGSYLIEVKQGWQGKGSTALIQIIWMIFLSIMYLSYD